MQLNLKLGLNRITNKVILTSKLNPIILFIGGYSRSGKTFFSNQINKSLKQKGFKTLRVSMDLWIVPLSKREKNTTVLERYRFKEFKNSLNSLIKGRSIKVLAYDSKSREQEKLPTKIISPKHPFILIIDGVLALKKFFLQNKKTFKIFIETNDYKRCKRLIKMYRDDKNIPKDIYKKIIQERELEEIKSIRKTKKNADMIIKN